MRSRPSAATASPPKIAAAFPSSWLFQLVTWVGCTWWCAEISATVLSPRIASTAMRGLKYPLSGYVWLLHGLRSSGHRARSRNPLSTTVSQSGSADRHRAAWAAIEAPSDGSTEQVSKRGDGIGNVPLHSAGCRAACSLRVGQTLVIERSFFYCHRLSGVGPRESRKPQYTVWRGDESRANRDPRSARGQTPA